MKYDSIIWDFNGTLYDDLEVCFSILNDMLTARGHSPLPNIDRYKEIFGFPIRDYYIKAGFDLEKEDFKAMSEEYIERYNKATKNCTLKYGIKELLEELYKKNIKMYILSACEQKMLEEYAANLGISEYISEIYGLSDYMASGKEGIGKKLMAEHRLKMPLLIGDTDHDMAVAKSIGADCIFVSWGHQSKDRLLQLNDKVYDTAKELREILLQRFA